MVDYALFMNLISGGKKLAVVPKALLLYRRHGGSVTRTSPRLPAEMKLIRNANVADRLTALSIRQLLRGTQQELAELHSLVARRDGQKLVQLAEGVTVFLDRNAWLKRIPRLPSLILQKLRRVVARAAP